MKARDGDEEGSATDVEICAVPRVAELAAVVKHLVRARAWVVAHITDTEELDHRRSTFIPGLTILNIKVRERGSDSNGSFDSDGP